MLFHKVFNIDFAHLVSWPLWESLRIQWETRHPECLLACSLYSSGRQSVEKNQDRAGIITGCGKCWEGNARGHESDWLGQGGRRYFFWCWKRADAAAIHWDGEGAPQAESTEVKAQRQERAQHYVNCISKLSIQEQWKVTEDALNNTNSSQVMFNFCSRRPVTPIKQSNISVLSFRGLSTSQGP